MQQKSEFPARARLIAVIVAAIGLGCGGGGAAVESTSPTGGNPTEPSTPSPAPTPAPTAPGSATVTTPGTSFSPTTVSVAPGASVTWQITGGTHNVTFGANKPTGGDIPDTNAGRSVSRTFPAAGTFDYQCTRHSGMTGRVVVGDAGAPGAPSGPSEEIVVQSTASAYTPERIEIAPGSVVTWEISAGAGGVVFDEESPEGGDIPASGAAQRVSRTFSAAGDYDYHNSRNGDVKGRVRVR